MPLFQSKYNLLEKIYICTYLFLCTIMYFLFFYGFNLIINITFGINHLQRFLLLCISFMYIPFIVACYDVNQNDVNENNEQNNNLENVLTSPCITNITQKHIKEIKSLKTLCLHYIHIITSEKIYANNDPNNILALNYYKTVPDYCNLEIPINLKQQLINLFFECPEHYISKPFQIPNNMII